MNRPRVDYDQLASTYDARYAVDRLQGIADALVELAVCCAPKRVLEVGCGTGRWLHDLRSRAPFVCGVDASLAMLRQSAHSHVRVRMVAARANQLPFPNHAFDLMYCVNAVHHFDDPEAFINQAAELLAPDGVLSIIGIDPRLIRHWYLYEYFEGARDTDLWRYPSWGDVVNWMAAARFAQIEYRIADRMDGTKSGRSILSDPFLKKESNSLLALLSDEEYHAGLRRIESAIAQAESEGRAIQFPAELEFAMVTGFRRAG